MENFQNHGPSNLRVQNRLKDKPRPMKTKLDNTTYEPKQHVTTIYAKSKPRSNRKPNGKVRLILMTIHLEILDEVSKILENDGKRVLASLT